MSEEEERIDYLRGWFGDNVWAADDFGGMLAADGSADAVVIELFDVILPDWRDWTFEGRQNK